MGCLKLSYYEQERALEVNPIFFTRAVEKNANTPIFCLSSSRYGFNGMEKDDEVKGGGNSYTSTFRELDSRLGGRWWSPDPVFKPWESPYAWNTNNPISIIDPNGSDGKGTKDKNKGTATLKANIIFQNDGTVSDEDFNKYVDNFMKNVSDVYSGQTFQEGGRTYTLNLDEVKYSVANPEAELELGKYDNLLTVGSKGISHIDGKRGNSGFLNVNDGGNTAAHEFAHIFGLSDRYTEGLQFSGKGNDLLDGSDGARFTIELFGIRDYQVNNLMGVGGNNITNKQLGIMINNKTERNYSQVVVIKQSDISLGFNRIQVRSIMGFKFVKTDGGSADWASPFMGGFQTGSDPNAKRLTRRNGLNVNEANRKLIKDRIK